MPSEPRQRACAGADKHGRPRAPRAQAYSRTCSVILLLRLVEGTAAARCARLTHDRGRASRLTWILGQAAGEGPAAPNIHRPSSP